MTLLDYSYSLFKDIKEGRYSFTFAINKKASEFSLSSSETNIVKACLKATINRYYYLQYEIKQNFPYTSEELIDMLILSLSYSRYVSSITVKDVMNFIKESENSFLNDLDLVLTEEKLLKLKDAITPLDEKTNSNFVKKTAIQYSYPEWLVGMLNKHFGQRRAFKSIASSKKTSPINVVINPKSALFEIVDDDFKKIEFTSCAYEYLGKDSLIDHPYFKEKKIYVMDASEQLLVDVLSPYQGDEVLVIGENKAMLTTTIGLLMNNLGKVYYSSNTQESYFNSLKSYEKYKVKNVMPFEGNIDLVCTHVSNNSLDKVLVIPPNSEFGLIRRKPEILINFRQNQLDSLIEGQKKYLLESSKFVKEDGILVYAVPTLNLKESVKIVHSFLDENQDFELDKEELIFPYKYQTTGIYYAKLHKCLKDVEENDD